MSELIHNGTLLQDIAKAEALLSKSLKLDRDVILGRIMDKHLDAIKAMARTPQPVTPASDADAWANYEYIEHVDNWMISHGLLEITHEGGPLACAKNVTDSLEKALYSAKPVTPAGGEVDRKRPFAFYNADKGTFFWLNEEVGAPEKVTGIINLYTHPPVADAALPRGHSISDAKQALGVDESLNIEALRGLLSIYEKCPATGQREVIALKAAIAALNQRGGGDHG